FAFAASARGLLHRERRRSFQASTGEADHAQIFRGRDAANSRRSRHNLERGRWEGRGTTAFADDPPINDDAGKSDTAAFEPPLEPRMRPDRRDLALKEERFARERRRHQREPAPETARRLQASADQRVAELESRLAEIVRATTTSLDALEVELPRKTME